MSADEKPAGKPGIVIFTAILNFFSTAAFFGGTVVAALALVFGAAWGVDQYVQQQMAHYAPSPNYSYGVAVVIGTAAVLFLACGIFFLAIGLGLLKGKKYAWYLQVAMSTLGLLGLPVSIMTGALMLPLGSILNIVILVLFFQRRVRAYFGI